MKIIPKARTENIVVQDLEKETLIYDLTENKAFSLNESSSAVWKLCDGSKMVSEIAENLSENFKSSISENFVWLALEQLKKENLLENAEDVAADFGGSSRREVIRKVGLATLTALPLVSALVAPTAAYASSTCSTAAPGGVLCRCVATDVPSVGDNCGTNYASNDICNPGCTCRRTAATCPPGPYTGTGTAGTCQGNCV